MMPSLKDSGYIIDIVLESVLGRSLKRASRYGEALFGLNKKAAILGDFLLCLHGESNPGLGLERAPS